MLIFSPILVVVFGVFLFFIAFLVNAVLTVLTLVSLCSRACGYKKTVRTRESYRKALKEIFPLLILPIPSYFLVTFPFFLFIIILLSQGMFSIFTYSKIVLLVSSALGLITVLSFALHLCFIGKTV